MIPRAVTETEMKKTEHKPLKGTIRVGIVGCGGIAQVHAGCLDRLEGTELVAAADIRLERAEELTKSHGGRAYASLEEMLKEENIQVLHICTPHYLHVPMAVSALEQGYQVFMEKPPVMTYEEYDSLKKAAFQSEGQLGLCFQNRYNPGSRQAKELFLRNIPGKVIGGRAIVSWSRGKEYYTESGWRGSLKTEGGGALINQAVHSLDLLTLFLGKPLTADAVMANHHLKGIIEVEDMMEAYIRYEEEVTGCFYATTAYCTNMPPIIELHCENMDIRIEEMRAACYTKEGREIESDALPAVLTSKRDAMGKSYWGAGHLDCITDFYRALSVGEAVPLGLEEVKDSVELMLAVYESARTGKEIALKES